MKLPVEEVQAPEKLLGDSWAPRKDTQVQDMLKRLYLSATLLAGKREVQTSLLKLLSCNSVLDKQKKMVVVQEVGMIDT